MSISVKRAFFATTAVLALSAAAQAEMSGFGGLGYSVTNGEGENASNEFEAGGAFVEGGFQYDLGSRSAIVTASYNGYTNIVENFPFDEDDPGYSFTLSGHYLYDLSSGLTVGGFATVGHSVPDGDSDDQWAFYGIGAEAHYAFSDMITAYGQLGIFQADNQDGDDNAQGAQGSFVVRAGVNYHLNDSTTLFADLELSPLLDYEDDDEDWVYSEFTLGGESLIANTNFAVTYEVSAYQTSTLAGGDNDEVMATSASLGVRYYFGAPRTARSQGIIGAPSTPEISSLYPSFHD